MHAVIERPLCASHVRAAARAVQESNGDGEVANMQADGKRVEVKTENVEYVSEQLDVKGPALEAFSDVFARFQPPPESELVRTSYSSTPRPANA